jgi:murein DD-endopeptidase MepM/ murein hydrolase activator NlpD
MRRIALVLALALACAGSASADTFRVLPSAATTGAQTPSGEIPNDAGSLALPLQLLTPPTQPQQLSFGELQGLWQRAGAAYGIPWTVLAAINKVESNFGENMGPSSAGAIGWMQFMPDTWLRWGTDGNGDGVADPWNAQDAIQSAARYLAAAGGATDIARAVYAYNHAQWYVDEVLQLAQAYGSGAQVAADLQALQQSVEQARGAVLAAQDALASAAAAEQTLVEAEDAVFAQTQSARLLSDRLALQKHAVAVDIRREQAHTLAEQRRVELSQAEAALAQAQETADTASFSPGARTLLSGASYDTSGYVFPVGGGPGLVSVGHSHHDYPAADIAAPEGSPVYALTDGVVESSWADDERCGTGFTFRADDGRSWTYCHLAYLDPAVAAGAQLAAGQQVGLVGHTGHATGPHLHLQLQPADSYPQSEAWFDAFAGTAFTWQDAPTVPEPSEPAFAVVSDSLPATTVAPASATPPPPPDATFAAPPAGQAGVVLFTR